MTQSNLQAADRVKRLTDDLAARPGVVQGRILSLAAPRVKAIKGSADGLEAPPMMERVPTTPKASSSAAGTSAQGAVRQAAASQVQ